MLASRTCPVCRTASIHVRQEVCSGRCRAARSRLRKAEARRKRDAEIRALLEAALKKLTEGPVMERRTFLAMIPGSLLAAPVAGGAQPAGTRRTKSINPRCRTSKAPPDNSRWSCTSGAQESKELERAVSVMVVNIDVAVRHDHILVCATRRLSRL